MSWATLAAATDDLRRLMADGPTDKIAYDKKLIGLPNGVNVRFKSFEARRVTNFSSPTSPEGVYVNGAAVTVASDDPVSGALVLTIAPVDGDSVTGTYYYQWFLDADVQQFVQNAVERVLSVPDPTKVPDGLAPAILHYASAEAFNKLAMRWTTDIAATYLMEDMPRDKQGNLINPYLQMAKQMEKTGETLRNDYYSRQGQSNAPLFASIPGAVRDPVPRR